MIGLYIQDNRSINKDGEKLFNHSFDSRDRVRDSRDRDRDRDRDCDYDCDRDRDFDSRDREGFTNWIFNLNVKDVKMVLNYLLFVPIISLESTALCETRVNYDLQLH